MVPARFQYRLAHKQLNWSISDSNRPPIDCEPIALPDELIPHNYIKNILHFRFYGKRFALSCFSLQIAVFDGTTDKGCGLLCAPFEHVFFPLFYVFDVCEKLAAF